MTEHGASFTKIDEMAHNPPGPEPSWQESVVVTWYDVDREIGGYHRIGHEPHASAATIWAGVVSAGGNRFRRDLEGLPLAEADRGQARFAAGNQALLLDSGALRLELAEEDCELSLELEDYFPPCAMWSIADADVAAATIPNHFESCGRASGRLRCGDETTPIEAFYVRDHSWGPRDWARVASHRWFAGSIGPELSWSIGVIRDWEGEGLTVAGIVREGRLEPVADFDLVRLQESDGVSHRGARALITTQDGEQIKIVADAFDGVVFDHHEYVGVDTPCKMTIGDGRVGGGIVEASDGLRRAIRRPALAVVESGISRRA